MDGVPDSLLETDPLGSVASPTAKAFAAQTNTPSDNFYAEMLLKRLGAGPNKQGTTARGAGRAEAFARKAGSGVNLVNGSGLARSNTASPKNVTNLLVHMRKDDSEKAAFFDSLAVAGKTGTLSRADAKHRGRGPLPREDGHDRRRERPLGLLQGRRGQVAFSILMNNVSISEAERAQDAMAAAIARYR